MSKHFELLQSAGIDLGKELAEQNEKEKGEFAADLKHGTPEIQGPGMGFHLGERGEASKLVSRLFLQAEKRPRMVTFAAIEDGGGAGRVCAAAASILAEAISGEICVLNANFEESSFPASFRCHERTGLRDVLLEDSPIREHAHQLQPKNLWLFPGGPRDGDLSQMLHSEKARARLLEFGSEFQHVLINAAPVLRDPGVTALAQLSDGLVLVVEAHSTRREVARRVKEGLELANVRLLGAVLNNRRFPIPSVLYNRL